MLISSWLASSRRRSGGPSPLLQRAPLLVGELGHVAMEERRGVCGRRLWPVRAIRDERSATRSVVLDVDGLETAQRQLEQSAAADARQRGVAIAQAPELRLPALQVEERRLEVAGWAAPGRCRHHAPRAPSAVAQRHLVPDRRLILAHVCAQPVALLDPPRAVGVDRQRHRRALGPLQCGQRVRERSCGRRERLASRFAHLIGPRVGEVEGRRLARW
mmetsp:Transcript_5982/g.19811  ORF Transcript_5982/g.19811 Transcript_5982/m.19811 type:complete len:217 (-) Transcript_5982:704-1354(-)